MKQLLRDFTLTMVALFLVVLAAGLGIVAQLWTLAWVCIGIGAICLGFVALAGVGRFLRALGDGRL